MIGILHSIFKKTQPLMMRKRKVTSGQLQLCRIPSVQQTFFTVVTTSPFESVGQGTSTPHRSETNGIAESAVRRVKEGTSAVVLQSGLKVGGQIPWNVTPICETSQIYYLMGSRPMKDDLGNHLKDQFFFLVHWLSITLITAKDH